MTEPASTILLTCLMSASLSTPSSARTWHILPDGSGDAQTIQAGIDSASTHDTVLVACGVYHEHDIVLKQGVCLRSMDGEAACATIDAEEEGRVLNLSAGSIVTRIEGFTVRAGAAVGPGLQGMGGGALFDGSSALLDACRFVENSAQGGGGGIWCNNSTLTLANCEFSLNESPSGGGLGCSHSELALSECAFTENSSAGGDGAGMWCGASNAGLTAVTFLHNSASTHEGGGLSCQATTLALDSCVFFGNSAKTGAGLRSYGSSVVEAIGCEFLNNVGQIGGSGGGARLYNFDCILRGCLFQENEAWSGGGVAGGAIEISDCAFIDNRASWGGGFYGQTQLIQYTSFSENQATYGGGGLFWTSALSVEHCTFYGNGANYGGGMYCPGSGNGTVMNTIIAFSTAGGSIFGWEELGAEAHLTCCDVYGNSGGDYFGIIESQGQSGGNFSMDPLFCDSGQGDLALDATSPCLAAPGCGQVGAFGQGCDVATGVARLDSALAVPLVAVRNAPNPFRATTLFTFRIPKPTDVSLTLHDITGRCVSVLASGFYREGGHATTWNGRDRSGREVASGTYFARLVVDRAAATEKVILVR